MSSGSSNLPESRMLPGGPEAARPVVGIPAVRQLQDLPKDELAALAEDFGLDSSRYTTPQHLVAALHERRQLIAALDREALLDVIKWGRRPVPINATKEQIAQEIARIGGMKFGGLSQRGLYALCRLRGCDAREDEDVPALVKKLKKQEGFFAKLNRKRRGVIGTIVSNMLGEAEPSSEYQFLPPQAPAQDSTRTAAGSQQAPPRATTIKEEIEESGLFGGIAGRIKKSADAYVNQKLDEIEARIDRKLDEIDRRLAGMRHLSMGMSNDYEQAILEGATLVRIGTALFGGSAGDQDESEEPGVNLEAPVRKQPDAQ